MTIRPRTFVGLAGLVPTVVVSLLSVYRPASLANLEHSVYDALVKTVPLRPPDGRIVIGYQLAELRVAELRLAGHQLPGVLDAGLDLEHDVIQLEQPAERVGRLRPGGCSPAPDGRARGAGRAHEAAGGVSAAG